MSDVLGDTPQETLDRTAERVKWARVEAAGQTISIIRDLRWAADSLEEIVGAEGAPSPALGYREAARVIERVKMTVHNLQADQSYLHARAARLRADEGVLDILTRYMGLTMPGEEAAGE